MAKTGTAIVMRSAGSSYTLLDSVTGETVESRLRGKLRLKGVRSTNPVAVGDKVDYEVDDYGESVITEIHPRKNYVIRRSPNLSKESHIIAANIDQAAIVVTLFSPVTNVEFIDRFLVTCEAYHIPVTIVLNKIDLAGETPEAVEEFKRIYDLAGYPVMEVSATENMGVEEFKEFLSGRTTLLSGNSGVGKSTLINLAEPEAEAKTSEISRSHHKGRHTTTFARMYPMSSGGYIIDTPGIKGFGLIDIDPDELYRYFPELMKYSSGCQYYNCTHVHEPGCAVIDAVQQGLISESRYISYLKTLEEDEKYR